MAMMEYSLLPHGLRSRAIASFRTIVRGPPFASTIRSSRLLASSFLMSSIRMSLELVLTQYGFGTNPLFT